MSTTQKVGGMVGNIDQWLEKVRTFSGVHEWSIKSGPGTLNGFSINTAGAGSVTLYDGDKTGAVLATFLGSGGGDGGLHINFVRGLYAVVKGPFDGYIFHS